MYIIGANDYQPSKYWYVLVGYGSCSGCDTLEAIKVDYDEYDGLPSERQVDQYYGLALNVVQGIKEMDRGW